MCNLSNEVINSIRSLSEGEGLTFKKGAVVNYKTGYQVATEGAEVTTANEAIEVIRAMDGNCGIWLSEGIYYVDKCHRVSRKRDAIAEGIRCNQISIYDWKHGDCIYLR